MASLFYIHYMICVCVYVTHVCKDTHYNLRTFSKSLAFPAVEKNKIKDKLFRWAVWPSQKLLLIFGRQEKNKAEKIESKRGSEKKRTHLALRLFFPHKNYKRQTLFLAVHISNSDDYKRFVKKNLASYNKTICTVQTFNHLLNDCFAK